MKKNRGKVLWLAMAVLFAITGAAHADSGAALTKEVQAVTSQSDVDQTVVEQAVQNRSGMPVRLN